MATGMHMDERSVDCLVLGHHDQDRKVSAKSVTMCAMILCKNLSGYRELLLNTNKTKQSTVRPIIIDRNDASTHKEVIACISLWLMWF